MTSQATTQPNNLLPGTNTEPFTVFDDIEEFDDVTESPSYDYTTGNSDISNRSKTSLNEHKLTPEDKKKIGKCFDKCFPVQFPGCVPCRKCLYKCKEEGTPISKSGPCIASCRNDCSRCPNVFKCVPVCLKLIQSLLNKTNAITSTTLPRTTAPRTTTPKTTAPRTTTPKTTVFPNGFPNGSPNGISNGLPNE